MSRDMCEGCPATAQVRWGTAGPPTSGPVWALSSRTIDLTHALEAAARPNARSLSIREPHDPTGDRQLTTPAIREPQDPSRTADSRTAEPVSHRNRERTADSRTAEPVSQRPTHHLPEHRYGRLTHGPAVREPTGPPRDRQLTSPAGREPEGPQQDRRLTDGRAREPTTATPPSRASIRSTHARPSP